MERARCRRDSGGARHGTTTRSRSAAAKLQERNGQPMEPREEAKLLYQQAQREAARAAEDYFLRLPEDLDHARQLYEQKMAAYLAAEARLRELDPETIERW